MRPMEVAESVGFRTSPITTDAFRHRGYTIHVSSAFVTRSSSVRRLSPRQLRLPQLSVRCSSIVRQLFVSQSYLSCSTTCYGRVEKKKLPVEIAGLGLSAFCM